MTTANERKAWLREASKKANDQPVRIKVRALLGKWDAQRRGYWIVQRIERELKATNLRTDPPFDEVWIDALVSLVPDGKRNPESDMPSPEVGLRIGQLPSANTGVTAINPQDTIQKAQALMMKHDFSQLPVLSGSRDTNPTAVTWESIAQARVRSPDVQLADTAVSVTVVSVDDDLIELIPRIVDAGFVLVRNAERVLNGIVTTADLSVMFSNLASPFLMLGEIERRIRQINASALSMKELAAGKDPGDEERTITSVADLTLGELERLMQRTETWPKYGWEVDRVIFLDALRAVRDIRNDVMHFNPDPLTDDQLSDLQSFLKWIRSLDSTGAR